MQVVIVIVNALISIHALLAESDSLRLELVRRFYDFYPRSPCGERQPSTTRRLTNIIISIHALLAESDIIQWEGMKSLSISIHALLAESDKRRHKKHLISQAISIHALLAESDTSL